MSILKYKDSQGNIKNIPQINIQSTSVDNTLSDTSENPVQNKVVKQALDNLDSNKVNKEAGKGLSTNDFTNEDKQNLDDINGAIGVDAYDDTATYDVNDLCIKDNTLHICTTPITTAEAWNSAHWKAITIADMLISKTEINNIVTELNKKIDVSNIEGTATPTTDGLMSSTDFKKINAQAIEASSDLNNITAVGWYHCKMNTTAATLSNCPTSSAFYMEVHEHAGIYQNLVEYKTSDAKIFFRNKYGGTWGPWQDITDFLPLAGGTMTGAINCANITPKAYNSYSSGNNSTAWKSICSNIFYINNGAGASSSSSYTVAGTSDGISVAGKIKPFSTKAYDLGSSNLYWNNAYIKALFLNNVGTARVETSYGTHTLITCPTSAGAIRGLVENSLSTYAKFEGSAFSVLSSQRYKENIKSMTEKEANLLDNIEVVTYDYKNKDNGIGCRGVIAEQVAEYIPWAVLDGVDTDGNYHKIDAVDYNRFVPYLIKKVQMQEKRLTEMEKRLSLLEEKNG